MKHFILGDGPVGISFASLIPESILVTTDKRLPLFKQHPPTVSGAYTHKIAPERIISFTEFQGTDLKLPKAIWICLSAPATIDIVSKLNLSKDDYAIVTCNGLNILEDLPKAPSTILRLCINFASQFQHVLDTRQPKVDGDNRVNINSTPNVSILTSWPDDFKKVLSNFQLTIYSSVLDLEWSKILINAWINPLTLIFGAKNNSVVNSESLSHLLQQFISEVLLVAKAAGANLPHTPTEHLQTLKSIAGENIASSDHAFLANKPTDFEYTIDRVLATAKKHNIETANLEMLHALLAYRLSVKS